MEKELAELESQLEQLIAEHDRLKKDNAALRGRVDRLETDNHQFQAKLELAVGRLEQLLEQLPEE